MAEENVVDTSGDEFDKAFAEAAAEAEVASTPEPEKKEEPAPEPEKKEEPVPEPEKKEEPAPEPEKKEEPAPEKKPEPTPEPEKKPEPVAETPEQKAQREAFEESVRPYELTEAEQAAMKKFEADFPEEFLAVQARLKATDRDINARVHSAVQAIVKHYDSRLAPVEQSTLTIAQEQHIAALHTAHPDYDTVIEKVPAWIKSQPSYLQPALQAVYDKGTAQDVIAMVSDFKKATAPARTPEQNAAEAKAAAEAQAKADAAAKAKKDAADLAPVNSKRTTTLPKGSPDPNDFAGAWAEAVAQLDSRG